MVGVLLTVVLLTNLILSCVETAEYMRRLEGLTQPEMVRVFNAAPDFTQFNRHRILGSEVASSRPAATCTSSILSSSLFIMLVSHSTSSPQGRSLIYSLAVLSLMCISAFRACSHPALAHKLNS